MIAAVEATADLSLVPEALGEALAEVGLAVDRVQLPLSQQFGFKHPFYIGMVTTWTVDGVREVFRRPRTAEGLEEAAQLLERSPYRSVACGERTSVVFEAGTAGWEAHERLLELELQGFVSYAALSVELPTGARQVVSVASKHRDAFPPETIAGLTKYLEAAAPALDAVYRLQTLREVARTYLGAGPARRVLAGELGLGESHRIEAVVAFMDLRDFTQTMNELGEVAMLRVVNAAVGAIDEAVARVGGEILKIMGDATLVVFARPDRMSAGSEEERFWYRSVLATCLRAVASVPDATEAAGRAMQMGLGIHYGTVEYGNIGSRRRRDFTVMGPVVNMAARLESMSKELGACAVVSEQVASRCAERNEASLFRFRECNCTMQRHRDVSVRGYDAPVTVWSVSRAELVSGAWSAVSTDSDD